MENNAVVMNYENFIFTKILISYIKFPTHRQAPRKAIMVLKINVYLPLKVKPLALMFVFQNDHNFHII